MFDYEKFIEDFNDKYYQNFMDKADLVIESFVKFYGEKHRTKITNAICDVSILSFMPTSTEEICNDIIPMNMFDEAVKNTYYILSILGLANIASITDGTIGEIVEKDGEVEVLNCEISEVYNTDNEIMDELLTILFGSTNLFNFDYEKSILYNFFSYDKEKQKAVVYKIFKTDTITKDILEKIKSVISFMDNVKNKTHGYEKYINATLLYNYYKMKGSNNSILKRIVGTNNLEIPSSFEDLTDDAETLTLPNESFMALPIFITNDDIFVHETNHVLTSTTLATIDDYFLIEKFGIGFVNTAEIGENTKSKQCPWLILCELLNERIAQDITNIIHESGCYIFDEANTYNIPAKLPYQTMLPLIETFYQKYKELLKEACITSNQRLIYAQIDKQAFEDFQKFISEVYIKVAYEGEELTKQQIAKAEYYTQKLQRPPYNEIDIKEYLNELEESGYKITRLNSDDDDSPKKLLKLMQKQDKK